MNVISDISTYRGDITALIIFLILAGLLVLVAIITRSRRFRRALWNKSPFPESGGLAALTSLAPFEAGIVLSVEIKRVLAMYLMDLVISGLIEIEDPKKPAVKVKDKIASDALQSEIFGCFGEDGSPEARKLLAILDKKYNSLENKIQSFNVKKTVMYYLEKVDLLWERLENEKSISKKIDLIEKEFPWLMLHEDAPDRLQDMFSNTTSWPRIQPVVKMMRELKNSIISDEDMLKHAASNANGIFKNRHYLEKIIRWALEQLDPVPDSYDDYFQMSNAKRDRFKKIIEESDQRKKEISSLLDTIYEKYQ